MLKFSGLQPLIFHACYLLYPHRLSNFVSVFAIVASKERQPPCLIDKIFSALCSATANSGSLHVGLIQAAKLLFQTILNKRLLRKRQSIRQSGEGTTVLLRSYTNRKDEL